MLDTPRRDQVTVEAETVEDALAEISAEFGENAEIMRAQKVHRGGVGGFFAKEMVQLTARRRRDDPPPLRPSPKGGGIADVLERMAQDADAEDSDFRTVLQRELGSGETDVASEASLPAPHVETTEDTEDEQAADVAADPVPVKAEIDDLPEPVAVGPVLRPTRDPVVVPVETDAIDVVVVDPDPIEPESGPVIPLRKPVEVDFDEAASSEPEVVDEVVVAEAPAAEVLETGSDVELETGHAWRTAQPEAPEGMGAVSWGKTALLRLGMPGPVISAVEGLDPHDDLGWIEGIAAAVAPHCGSLPDGDVIVVGPHAERLAEPLGLPLIRSGDMAPYDGSFCAMVEDRPEDRQWLEYVRGGRGIHLVVGDEPWQDLLVAEPLAVSWVGETAVADALYLAFTLGATLGFGTVDGFVSSMVRAQPTDVALAVRRIVGRR